jgi:replicative DNA helicase
MITDKMPPQNIEAEASVIGACMNDPDVAAEVLTILTSEMFYKQAHVIIFEAISICLRGGGCDLVSITDYLGKKGRIDLAGGVVYLTDIASKYCFSGRAVNMALMVKEKYLLREYIRIGWTMADMGFSEDAAEVMQYAEGEIYKIGSETHKKDFRHISKSMDELLIKIDKLMSKELTVVGVPSGFLAIDRYTSGWQQGDLVILAGRPSMGKTAMALQFARGAAESGYAVGVFSLEMSEEQIAGRYLSAAAGLSNTQIKTGDIDSYSELIKKSERVASLPIYVDDTSALGLFELRSKAKKMVTRHGVKFIIVDYLQLMKGEGASREQEVSMISRGLKAIAKELTIPVMALSQLNRRVESTGDKRPNLSDLRESGAIEQDADMVMFVFRPAYYKQETISVDSRQVSSDKLILLDIAKHRNGALGSIPLYHNVSMTEITEIKDINLPFE